MPQTNSVLSLVETDLQLKKYNRAMQRLVSISNQCSHDLNFLGLLSLVQKALSDHSGQIKTLEVIAQKTKTQLSKLDFMAALYTEGRLNEALDVGLSLQEQDLNEINSKYFTRMMVRIYLEFSDYEGLNEVLEAYQSKYELDDLMCWAQGIVSLASADQNSALKSFRQAINLNAANDQAWVSLAMIHEDMGDRELALANLERALDINPENSTAIKMLARWYRPDVEGTRALLSRLSFYLAEHNFDEEVSLCYVHLLKEDNKLELANFELEKQILYHPGNPEFLKLKNNLQDPMNL